MKSTEKDRESFRVVRYQRTNGLTGEHQSTYQIQELRRVWWLLWLYRVWCTVEYEAGHPGNWQPRVFSSDAEAWNYVDGLLVGRAWARTQVKVTKKQPMAKEPEPDEPKTSVIEDINHLLMEEGNSITLLCDNPEADKLDEQSAIEVNCGFTRWITRRYYGSSWQEAVSKAASDSRYVASKSGDL